MIAEMFLQELLSLCCPMAVLFKLLNIQPAKELLYIMLPMKTVML